MLAFAALGQRADAPHFIWRETMAPNRGGAGRSRRQPELQDGPLLCCCRCPEPTQHRRRLYDGGVWPLCDHCWETTFTEEQRRRIDERSRRLEFRIIRCADCRWPIRQAGDSTAKSAINLCPTCRRSALAALRIDKERGRKSKVKIDHGFGIMPFRGLYRGGLPTLGKRR
jgi:hypothetical protein